MHTVTRRELYSCARVRAHATVDGRQARLARECIRLSCHFFVLDESSDTFRSRAVYCIVVVVDAFIISSDALSARPIWSEVISFSGGCLALIVYISGKICIHIDNYLYLSITVSIGDFESDVYKARKISQDRDENMPSDSRSTTDFAICIMQSRYIAICTLLR